ncbi:MAG: DUF3581 family protein [bacterium]
MLVDDFYLDRPEGVEVSRDQASRFAKQVAGDFNPLHDADASRFCVPGDLLFSLVLSHYGLSQRMCFRFAGMVGDGRVLQLPDTDDEKFSIQDADGKEYLSVERSGENTHDPVLLDALTRNYVAFSGTVFPDLLVPLLKKHEKMINPDRPLVIYESMSVELDRVDISAPELVQGDAEVEVNGKRGEARLKFEFRVDGETVGKGVKRMLLSGLQPYDESRADTLVSGYNARKASYQQD